jgi:hypothetical protein
MWQIPFQEHLYYSPFLSDCQVKNAIATRLEITGSGKHRRKRQRDLQQKQHRQPGNYRSFRCD